MALSLSRPQGRFFLVYRRFAGKAAGSAVEFGQEVPFDIEIRIDHNLRFPRTPVQRNVARPRLLISQPDSRMFPQNRHLFRSDRQRIGSRLAKAVSFLIKPLIIIFAIAFACLTDGMGELPHTRKGWRRLAILLALIGAVVGAIIALS